MKKSSPQPVSKALVAAFFRDTEHRLSRNRNFHAYESPATQRAVRASQYLKGLRDTLLRARPDAISVEPAPDRHAEDPHHITLRLTIHDLGCQRTAFLNADEFMLLCDTLPWLRDLLHDEDLSAFINQ